MKITVWGINYAPEPTGIGPFNTDLCMYFAERGHDVTMVTSFPYYPWWRKQPGFEGEWYRRTVEHGIKLCRCWHYVPKKPTTLTRVLHELSFVFSSFWPPLLDALRGRRPDVFILISPPLFLGPVVMLVAAICRRPVVYHVQDMQPDAAVGLGMVKFGAALKVLYALEKWNYQRSSLVSGISQGMIDAFTRKKVTRAKQILPNWIPDEERPPAPGGPSFRAANGIGPDEALVAYSGNVGLKQGLEVVVEAAVARARSPGGRALLWAICGEGSAKPALQEMIARSGVEGRVRLYPLQPDELYHSLLREADVSLIAQQRGTGQFFFPSKLLSIVQYGRPVLAVADESSELARAVREGDFGLVVPPGDAPALVAAAERMTSASAEDLERWRRNGRSWGDQFRRSRVLGEFEQRLEHLVRGRGIPVV